MVIPEAADTGLRCSVCSGRSDLVSGDYGAIGSLFSLLLLHWGSLSFPWCFLGQCFKIKNVAAPSPVCSEGHAPCSRSHRRPSEKTAVASAPREDVRSWSMWALLRIWVSVGPGPVSSPILRLPSCLLILPALLLRRRCSRAYDTVPGSSKKTKLPADVTSLLSEPSRASAAACLGCHSPLNGFILVKLRAIDQRSPLLPVSHPDVILRTEGPDLTETECSEAIGE